MSPGLAVGIQATPPFVSSIFSGAPRGPIVQHFLALRAAYFGENVAILRGVCAPGAGGWDPGHTAFCPSKLYGLFLLSGGPVDR